MPAISSLIKKLSASYPDLTFAPGEYAHWSPATRTVYYYPTEAHATWVTLHEAAHGILAHSDYTRDISLLRLEQEAWSYAATTLAPRFDITIDPEFIESQLDTYRDWLHAKSTCPSCQSNGFEHKKHLYLCIFCGHTWRVNTGTTAHIRRMSIV